MVLGKVFVVSSTCGFIVLENSKILIYVVLDCYLTKCQAAILLCTALKFTIDLD